MRFMSQELPDSLGHHVVLDLYDCESTQISDFKFMQSMMHESAKIAKCHIVNECFHEFNPAGVSGCIIISESNFCLHTWHEHKFVAVDLFYCGQEVDIEKAVQHIIDCTQSKRVCRQDISRGLRDFC